MKRDLQIINGTGEEVSFSPVFEHLKDAKPKAAREKKKAVIIPEVKKKETANKEINKQTKKKTS